MLWEASVRECISKLCYPSKGQTFYRAQPWRKIKLRWSWGRICHLTEASLLPNQRKVVSYLLLLEAKLNLKLLLLLLDSSCSLLSSCPDLGQPVHFAEGNQNTLENDSPTTRLWYSHKEIGPSAPSVRGLIPKVAYYHLELFSPRLVLGARTVPRWSCYHCSSSATPVEKVLVPEVWEQPTVFLHSHPETVIWNISSFKDSDLGA